MEHAGAGGGGGHRRTAQPLQFGNAAGVIVAQCSTLNAEAEADAEAVAVPVAVAVQSETSMGIRH